MSLQIPLSIAGSADAFAARLAAFRQARLDHHKTVGVPAPREDGLIEAMVRRVPRRAAPDDYVIEDYEIVDDHRRGLRAWIGALFAAAARKIAAP